MKPIFSIAVFLAIASLVAVGADAPKREKNEVVAKETTDRIFPMPTNNIITYSAPRAVPLSTLGLDKLGLTTDLIPFRGTELRIFADRAAVTNAPKRRLYLNSQEGGSWWYYTGGMGSAEAHVIQPGEFVVLMARGITNEIPWKNPLAEQR
ncbi:MAG: hypothetical protein M5U15_03475 [Kiritimatiellae bacterium]|nr:hypothetical protein [Kiritimatiellia bacterium]